MSDITKEDVSVAVVAVFFALLLWNILVVNHNKDVERDKFYATHCRVVEQKTFSNRYECVKP